MVALVRTILKKNALKMSLYFLINASLAWLFVALFPSIQEDAAELTELFRAYPEDFLKAFGIESGATIFSSFEAFLSIEYFSIMWPLLILAFIISYAASTIAGEIEHGTIDILLSQPLSRAQLFLSKYVAGFLMITCMTVVTIATPVFLAVLYGIDFPLEGFVYVGILGELFSLSVFSLSLLFSSMLSVNGKALSVPLFIVLGMYALKIASELNESVQDIKYLSLFHYFDYNAALIDNTLPVFSVLVFAGLSMLGGSIALFYFKRRDIAA